MNVLQLGPVDWSTQYEIPKDIKWEFNNYPPKSKKEDHGFSVVVVTGPANLTDHEWQELQWKVDPYNVCYFPGADTIQSKAGKHFLKCAAAQEIYEEPQDFIDHLLQRHFFGQSGIRILPTLLLPFRERIDSYEMQDEGHVKMNVDTNDQWVNIGSYRQALYIDPNRLMNFWLEFQSTTVEARLRVFVQESGGDGNPNSSFVINMTADMEEHQLPIEMSASPRFASISLEVKGMGEFILGNLHSRWGRDGSGEFIAGGKRIVNPALREDVAYYFNPGDLRPPLNVYFSGARGLEGFEAFPLFRNLHAPALLFTDMRMEVGQFYTTDAIEKQIKAVIEMTLQQIGFDRSQLIMNGISMGTYPAIKLGAELGAYAINVAKPLTNLGLIAERGRIERPGGFDTSFDIDNRLTSTDSQHLQMLDQKFWKQFAQNDLSKTRLFVAYMENDDYDNQTINKLRACPAVDHARQFITKGFPGRHNDNPQINFWFIRRLQQMMKDDFGRKD